jgi:hypothetical protein
VQGFVWPHSPPLQPLKADPAAGVAVNLTDVPAANAWLQSFPQFMPTGLELTVPLPFPDLLTVRPLDWGLNVAVQAMFAFIVTAPSWQSALPLQPPKTEPGAGVAINLTAVPLLYVCAQAAPQFMPLGELVTVPLPDPLLARVFTTLTLRAKVDEEGFGGVPLFGLKFASLLKMIASSFVPSSRCRKAI